MKVKEIDRTVNTAWSPGDHHPILLAAGTAAQQLDASFSTSASLEIFALNLTDSSPDLEPKYSVPSQHRYHKVAWGGESPGVIVGGCDNGVIQMYNVSKLLNKEDGLIANPERHTGAVKSLDFNPFQRNLLATGATNSEIFIWDMNNTSTPMSPGVKSQPLEDVAWLAWNRQVQHILASTFPTRNVVWDLRKNEPIIKLTDATTRVRWKVVAWHPEVATQLCLASEEDSNPVVQLWDLRFATSPLKTFKGHTRGVLSLAWCNQDPDLLISSGKDNKILCWNPNSNNTDGEIVCEIPNSQQWIFEVNWCPRNPSLIVSSSCDGHTSIYSITGSPATQVQTNTKIADSFPGMGEAIPEPQIPAQQPVVDLKKAPKWLRRPVGATFGFGGKLVTFGSEGVKLLQLSGDESFLDGARALGERLQAGNYSEICRGKQDPVWRYLEASFSSQPRVAIRALLGYNKESVLGNAKPSPVIQNNVDQLSDQFSNLGQENIDGSNDNLNYSHSDLLNGGDEVFDKISSQNTPVKSGPFSITLGDDVESQVCKALLAGCIEEAINISLKDGKIADALILSITAGPDILAETQRKYFQKREGYLSYILNALVTEDWRPVARQCDLGSWKEALAAILTYCTDGSLAELCYELGKRLEEAGDEYSSSAEICYIASGNIAPLIHKRLSGITVSTENIQEMVELVLVAQGAYSSRGQVFPVVGDVAKVLTLYAELLSAEGDLDTALQYVNDSSDEIVEDLRERLYYALGHKSMPNTLQNQQVQQQYSVHQSQPAQGLRKASITYQNVVNSQPNAVNTFNKPPIGNAPASHMPPVQNLPPAPLSTSDRVQVGPPPASAAPPQGFLSRPVQGPAQPPPPQSPFVRSSPSPQIQSGVTTKKYVVDPSVTGGVPGGFRSSSTLPYSQQFQPSPGFQPFQPPGSSPYQPTGGSAFQPLSSYAPPSQSSGFQSPTPSSFQPPPSSSFQPPQNSAPFQPPGPSSFQQATFQPPGSSVIQSQNTFAPQQNQMFKPQAPAPPTTGQVQSTQNAPASGWNDPPSLAPKSQPKTEPAQAPITHPLFGAAPPAHEMHPTSYQGQGQQSFQPPGSFQPPSQTSVPFQPPGPTPAPFNPPGQTPAPFNPPGQTQGVFQPPGQTPAPFQPPGQSPAPFQPPGPTPAAFNPPGHTPAPFNPPGQTSAPFQPPASSYQPTGQTPVPFQPPPSSRPLQLNQSPAPSGYGDPALVGRAQEIPRQKAPIPEKYAHIQTTFEDLRGKCASASQTNPLMRRKLDDVARKLEALYDSLREQKLSDSTVEGLEDLTKCVANSDYASGLNVITRLVSGSDFSNVATFMTGLKILIQTAHQLRVN